MVCSMTGYGRELGIMNGREILVEIKSVNHRFYEFSAKVPRAYGFLEEKLKALLQGHITRGKVEVYITINSITAKEVQIKINTEAAESYINALREANAALNLTDNIKLTDLLKFQDVFRIQKITEDEKEIWEDVRLVAGKALEKLISMRKYEGQMLNTDILLRLDDVKKGLAVIENAAPMLTEAYRERLYSKLSDVLEDKNIDEQRILTECAIFAEKSSVDEETVRLGSHIGQFSALLEEGKNVGRKLDFLIQEMNREVNTIGSKIQETEITKTVIELKSLLEKIREQIQNIE